MSSTVLTGASSLRHLPPSLRKVYQILCSGDPMRVNEIESLTQYSSHMVRYALRQLVGQRLVSQVRGHWHYFFTINR